MTHQCFLTNRGLYLLVWNVKDGLPGIESLNIWLQNLQVRTCVVYMYMYVYIHVYLHKVYIQVCNMHLRMCVHVHDLWYGIVYIHVFSMHLIHSVVHIMRKKVFISHTHTRV